MTDTGTVLQEEVETTGITQLHHGGWRKRKRHGITEAEEAHLGAFGQGKHILFGAGPFTPVVQANKGHCGVLATARKVETVDHEHRTYGVGLLVEQVVTHAGGYGISAFEA